MPFGSARNVFEVRAERDELEPASIATNAAS
jgi:hypothetical protein